MNYLFSPRNVFAGTASAAGGVAYVGIQMDWYGRLGWWPYVVLLGILVASGGWWAWDAYHHDRHMNQMARFASVNRWEFAPRTFDYARRFRSYPFSRGVNQEDLGLLRGTFNGMACATFTHKYEEGRDKERRTTYYWQITAVDLEFPLATVDILPDDWIAKAAKLVGGQDIDFESAEFNRRWRVKAGNAKYAHDVVHPRMMERLNQPDARGLALRIEGNAVIAWQADRQGPADLARRLGVLTSVAKLIPEFVFREFREVHERAEEAQRKREENAPEWAKTPYALTSGRYTGIGAEDYPEIEGPPPGDQDPDGTAGHRFKGQS